MTAEEHLRAGNVDFTLFHSAASPKLMLDCATLQFLQNNLARHNRY